MTSTNTFQALTSSKSNDWYTPEYLIKNVKEVLGRIDIDPASNYTANKWIDARLIYTKDDNGFTKSWYGKLFLNPPYGQASKKIGNYGSSAWLLKAYAEYLRGNVTEAIIVARGDSAGLKQLMRVAVFCEADRISFVSGDSIDRPNAPVPGTKIFYLGKHPEVFKHHFDKHGIVLKAL